MTKQDPFFEKVRSHFPALKQKVHGRDYVYLDSAATALKPDVVIERIRSFNEFEIANVHRGAHFVADRATQSYEGARADVAQFLHAASSDEIVFVRGTTEAINLVAQSYGRKFLQAGDEILITEMEHHANIVPWQLLADDKNLTVKAALVKENGELDLEDFRSKLSSKTKIVAITACSNILGTINDVKTLTAEAHKHGAVVLVDGAQIVSQEAVNVQDIDCDFFVFSGHKLFAPFGIGVLYGKKAILDSMPPYQGGGSMIAKCSLQGTTYNDVPFRFEAGTPNVEGAVGLATAIRFMQEIPFEKIKAHKDQLLKRATEGLLQIPSIKIVGMAKHKAPVLSFNMAGAHHSDIGQILDQQAIAVRAGHHCTQPLMDRFKIPGTVRASFSIYNNMNDVEAFLAAMRKAEEMFQ